MRNTFLFFVVLVLSAGLPTTAQAADEGEQREAREMMREGRKEIIAEELQLTAEEGPAFWEAYDAYRADLDPIGDRYARLVFDYMKIHDAGKLSDELALSMVWEKLEIERNTAEIRQKHLPTFRDILPGLKAARFYQLEFKIDAELDAELAIVVPLVESP